MVRLSPARVEMLGCPNERNLLLVAIIQLGTLVRLAINREEGGDDVKSRALMTWATCYNGWYNESQVGDDKLT